MQENNLLSLSFGRIVRKDINKNEGLLPESFETYQIVEKGDIVFRLTDLQNDQRSLRTALVPERGIITSAYVAVRVKGVHASFLAYQLRSYDLQKVFYSMGGGLRQTMKYEDLRWLPLLVPPAKEQVSIAAFLDRETTRIDALIEKKTRFIELLREKRQALITQAVTKGLDSDVPMKDSGVEWLGPVPAHWVVTKLKHMASAIIDCPHETPIYSDDGTHFVLRTADIADGRVNLSAAYKVGDAEYAKRVRRSSLTPGDIVYGREGERWGHAALVPVGASCCLGQRMMQIRAAPDADPGFLMWQMNSDAVYRQGQLDTLGSTSPHVNVGTIKDFWLAKPPPEEQRAIALWLDAKCAEFDKLSDSVERSIELLDEHRAALITAAVTGQIDLSKPAPRNDPAPKPASSPRRSREAAAHVEDPSRV